MADKSEAIEKAVVTPSTSYLKIKKSNYSVRPRNATGWTGRAL